MHIDECLSGIVTSRYMINSALLMLVRQLPTPRAATRSSWHTMMKQLLESAKLVVIGDVSTTMCSHSEAACRSSLTASKGHSINQRYVDRLVCLRAPHLTADRSKDDAELGDPTRQTHPVPAGPTWQHSRPRIGRARSSRPSRSQRAIGSSPTRTRPPLTLSLPV